jgi:hypothetical protein
MSEIQCPVISEEAWEGLMETEAPKRKTVVIEISGGNLDGVYSDLENVRFIVVDWDNIREGDEVETDYIESSLDEMSDETKAEIALAWEAE